MKSLTTLVRSLFLSTALATIPSVYSCGEESSKACVSDTECKGDDRICADGQCVYRDGKGDSGSESGDSVTIYGAWKPVNILNGSTGQRIDQRVLAEAVRNKEGIMMFERCTDESDRWHVLEGERVDNSCNYGDKGTFNREKNYLHLQNMAVPGERDEELLILNMSLNGPNRLTLSYESGRDKEAAFINPGDRWEFERIDLVSVYPCQSPCVRFLGR